MSTLRALFGLLVLATFVTGCGPEEKELPKESPEKAAELQAQHEAIKSGQPLPGADSPAPAAGGHGSN